jgi:hypothetical protein
VTPDMDRDRSRRVAAEFNNALERTRRVGVPASRAVVRVSPRRSTQCWADVEPAAHEVVMSEGQRSLAADGSIEQPPRGLNPDQLWNQLANAVALVAKQDQIVWAIFGAFWAANAVLLV